MRRELEQVRGGREPFSLGLPEIVHKEKTKKQKNKKKTKKIKKEKKKKKKKKKKNQPNTNEKKFEGSRQASRKKGTQNSALGLRSKIGGGPP